MMTSCLGLSRSRRVAYAVLALTTLSCSLERPDQARVRLEIPSRNEAANLLGKSLLGSQWRFLTDPASVDEMDCFVLNVTGPGIANSSLNHSGYNFAVDFPKALAGDACSTYGGAISSFVPVASGGNLEVTVPTGPQRLVQVLGARTTSLGCPSRTYFELEQQYGEEALEDLIPNLYEVGRQVKDVFGDVTLNLNNTYSASAPKDVQNCNSSYEISTDLLQLWFKPEGLPSLSNGTPIASWVNSSVVPGAPADISQATGINKPTFSAATLAGYPAPRFSPLSDAHFFSRTTDLNNFSSITHATAFTVLKLEAIGPSELRVAYQLTFSASALALEAKYISTNRYSFVATGGQLGTNFVESNVSYDVSPTAFRLATVRQLGTILELYVDGVLVASGSAQSHSGIPSQFRMGTSNSTTMITSWKGEIAEHLVYSRALSAEDRRRTECALSEKYQLGLAGC